MIHPLISCILFVPFLMWDLSSPTLPLTCNLIFRSARGIHSVQFPHRKSVMLQSKAHCRHLVWYGPIRIFPMAIRWTQIWAHYAGRFSPVTLGDVIEEGPALIPTRTGTSMTRGSLLYRYCPNLTTFKVLGFNHKRPRYNWIWSIHL